MEPGVWNRTKSALQNGRVLTAREIADEIDAEPFEVRSVLNRYAKKGAVVRVLPLEGVLQWRLGSEGKTQ